MIGFNPGLESSALAGMKRAETQIDITADRIAHWPTGTPNGMDSSSGGDRVDLSAEMLALMNHREIFDANVKSAQTADEIAKTLIGIVDTRSHR